MARYRRVQASLDACTAAAIAGYRVTVRKRASSAAVAARMPGPSLLRRAGRDDGYGGSVANDVDYIRGEL
jgi:hypothetical protein